MKEVILYGGAFDPPHSGHLAAIKTGLRAIRGAEIWVVPSHSDMFGNKALSSAHHRLNMLNLFLQTKDLQGYYVKICTEEIDRKHSTGTYTLINLLKGMWPTHKFYCLIGTDQADKIYSWKNSKLLIDEVPFITAVRTTKSVSSSQIRQAAMFGKEQIFVQNEDVDHRVAHYFMEHGLYKSGG